MLCSDFLCTPRDALQLGICYGHYVCQSVALVHCVETAKRTSKHCPT